MHLGPPHEAPLWLSEDLREDVSIKRLAGKYLPPKALKWRVMPSVVYYTLKIEMG